MNNSERFVMGAENEIKLSIEEEKKRQDFIKETGQKVTPEDFKWLLEEMAEKAEKEAKDKPVNPGRRLFLKRAAVAAASTVTAGVIWKGELLNKAIKLLQQKDQSDNSQVEIKKSEKHKEIDQPEAGKEAKIENLADYYLDAYNRISFDNTKFPGELFEKDLLIAQQCQESRGDVDAKSHSGALGVMQNMTVCLKDVTRYLDVLRRKTGFEWKGPKSLGEHEIAELKELITKKSDYSRAFGKIYLMQLWDDENGYGVGREAIESGGIKKAQIELMGSYNAGFGRIKGKSLKEWKALREKYRNSTSEKGKREFRAYNEAIIYVERIFNYKTRLGNVRNIFKELDIVFDENEDYAARQIALVLDEVTGITAKERPKALRQRTLEMARQFKAINTKEGRGPTDEEIDVIAPAKGIY